MVLASASRYILYTGFFYLFQDGLIKTSLPYAKICLIFNKRLVSVTCVEKEAGEHTRLCVLGTSGKEGDGEGKVLHVSVKLSSHQTQTQEKSNDINGSLLAAFWPFARHLGSLENICKPINVFDLCVFPLR